MSELTEDEENAIRFAYENMYDNYLTWKRKRSPNGICSKEMALSVYKKRLTALQSVITKHLKIDATFKDL